MRGIFNCNHLIVIAHYKALPRWLWQLSFSLSPSFPALPPTHYTAYTFQKAIPKSPAWSSHTRTQWRSLLRCICECNKIEFCAIENYVNLFKLAVLSLFLFKIWKFNAEWVFNINNTAWGVKWEEMPQRERVKTITPSKN